MAGLNASIQWVFEEGIDNIRSHEMALTQQLIDGLRDILNVKIYGGLDANKQTATVSFNIVGMEPSEVGFRLDEEHEILCRVGLHCTPVSHRTIGTFPDGTVRFGMGAFNTVDEVNTAVSAVRKLANGATT